MCEKLNHLTTSTRAGVRASTLYGAPCRLAATILRWHLVMPMAFGHEKLCRYINTLPNAYIYIYTRSSCALRAHSDRRGPVGHAPWIRTKKRNKWMRRIRRQIKIHKTRKEGGGDADANASPYISLSLRQPWPRRPP